MSAWAGIRPLVKDPNAENTQSLVRNHVVHVSDSNLITIAGGKWTTYRAMAQETVDQAVETCSLPAKGPSGTDGLPLEGGAEGGRPNGILYAELQFPVTSNYGSMRVE